MADSVLDWESIIHKNVRSRDYDDAGNVDAAVIGGAAFEHGGIRKPLSSHGLAPDERRSRRLTGNSADSARA